MGLPRARSVRSSLGKVTTGILTRVGCWAFALLGCSSEALDEPGKSQDPPSTEEPHTNTSSAQPRADFDVAPYPTGPYGRDVGATIQNLSFLGWRDAKAAGYDPSKLEVVSLSDFYDPTGSKGIRLLALNSAAVWCGVCREEYKQLKRDGIYAKYRPKGVEMLGVLFEDNNYDPAKPSDLKVWGGPTAHDVPFPLVIDPGFKTGAYFSSDATPMNMLIDTRTMEILDVAMGYDTSRPGEYWAAIDEWLDR
jgi:hypothetical protein